MPRSLVRALTKPGLRAVAPVEYSGRNRLALPFIRYNDLESQMRAMGAVGILFSIVDKLATGTAGVEWKLYRKAKSGKPEDRVEITSHPALTPILKPNSFTTRQEMFEAGQQHHELTGETWLVVGRNPKVPSLPLELWNVRPDRMKPIPDAKDFIVGYIYTSPDGEEVPLKNSDVIFIRRPNPLDPYRGIGAIGSVLAHIDGEKYSAEWNKNFFINGAIPGGTIVVDKRLSEPEFDEMVDRWREQHQGVANAHRVAILENGAKFVDMKLSQKDMDFTGLSNLSGEKIREAFGFPKPMLGSVDDVNRANAEAGEYVFARWMIVPRLDRWRAALNNDWLPLFGPLGEGLEFDYISPVPADRTADNMERDSKVRAAVSMIELGFDAVEVCEWLDLPVMSYTKPQPPASPSPPPGGAGSESDPPDGPDGPGKPGVPGEPADPNADNTYRLARFILDGPEDQYERRVEVVRMLVSTSAPRGHRDGHGGHGCRCGDRDDGEPWRARDAADPAGSSVPTPPPAPPGISPTIPEDARPDLGPLQDAWLAALERLMTAYAPMLARQKATIFDAVASRVANGDVIGLTSISVSPSSVTDASALIENAMMDLGMNAADGVVTDAGRQGIEDLHAMGPDRMRTASIAQSIATMLARDLVASAVVEALRVWRPGATPDQVRALVAHHLDSLTEARPRLLLGGALTGAQHDGRARTIAGGPEAVLYADEVLDYYTCPPCSDIDGKWLGNAGDAMVLDTYPVQGYVGCLGRQRCRGQVVAIWRGGTDWTRWVERP